MFGLEITNRGSMMAYDCQNNAVYFWERAIIVEEQLQFTYVMMRSICWQKRRKC